MSRLSKLKILPALGMRNIARVAVYRLGLRMGLHPCQKISASAPDGPFYAVTLPKPKKGLTARQGWANNLGIMFGQPVKMTLPPDWFSAQDSDVRAVSDQPWWTIPDFSPEVGDIKKVWEASRFDWVIVLAQRASLGQVEDLEKLNLWLSDWVAKNQPYKGVNWKCGQEASIRVMHLLLAALILGQENEATEGLQSLVRLHLKRIAPTIGYAIGQANNHGTSEAAALFIGGSFLGGKQGSCWAKLGRHWLENRAEILIGLDGTFSQYSVNYHRVMLDSYSFAEVWRRQSQMPEFSKQLSERMIAATKWLNQMTDKDTGNAPNLGANDGAQLIALTSCDYRDYRPSVQLAETLFSNQRAYETGPWDQQLYWLGLKPAKIQTDALQSTTMDAGGFHILRADKAVAYLRYPRFRFRPSQADALHCDFWLNGKNILRDAGTFSYNVSEQDTAYFNGAVAHNTIEFDNRDQMPRLGRFLFGGWLKSEQVQAVSKQAGKVSAAAAYRDKWQAYHHRALELTEKSLVITDKVSGFKSKAILRWRLCSGDWKLTDNTLSNGEIKLDIFATTEICNITLTAGYESRYYLQKTSLPVLEITVDKPGNIVTNIRF